MEDTMIKISGVSKQYRLGAIGGTTLREDLQRLAAKLRKKEDPTLKIGQSAVNIGERFWALNDISFEVKKGEAVGIIGHNGAGKSTLLKLITRVTAPTSGSIGLNGRVASMLEVGTGFHPELTGRENIYMNGAILGMSRKEIDEKLEQIIDFSEVRQFIDTPVKRYSSGMYVKLAFSVAAHLDSEIVIMDEVLAVGDMAFQNKCIDKMRNAAMVDGRTVLYVSHNMNTIRQLCNRVIVLDKGRLVYDGDVEGGIAIYMKHNDSVCAHYDYAGVKRSPDEARTLEMLGLDLTNGNGFYKRGNEIAFTLHCRANGDAEGIGLRFELFNRQGQIVGTTFSERPLSAKSGALIDIQATFSTKNLAVGKYTAVALLYKKNDYGLQVGIDRVAPALVFELSESEDDTLVWSHRYWGHVRFDDIAIKQITEKKDVQ